MPIVVDESEPTSGVYYSSVPPAATVINARIEGIPVHGRETVDLKGYTLFQQVDGMAYFWKIRTAIPGDQGGMGDE